MRRVFIGRRQEQEKLHQLARVTGTRGLLFMVGPSGIGKTALAESLSFLGGINVSYIPFLEPPRKVEEAVEKFLSHLGRSTSTRLLGAIVSDLTRRAIGESTAEQAKALLSKYDSGLEAITSVLGRLAEEASPDQPHVIVIDEAQNLYTILGTTLWSFVKTISMVQENSDAIRFIIITSDYFFYEKIVQESPSLDYIETFYLGEMIEEDAHELYTTLAGKPPGQILDIIGGKPAHLREVALYPEPHEKICSMIRKLYYAISTRLAGIECGPTLDEVLARIAVEPTPIAWFRRALRELEGECYEAMNWLIDADILQYGCKRFMGIYRWNTSSGGGLCGGLDSVGPSSRVSYVAILRYLGDSGYRIKVRSKAKEPLGPETLEVSESIMNMLKLCHD